MEELIKNDDFRLVDFLLSSDKREEIIEMRGGYNGTLLHVSARHDKLEMTKRLVKTGVDVTCTDGGGWTFAHDASWCGSVTYLMYVGHIFASFTSFARQKWSYMFALCCSQRSLIFGSCVVGTQC